MTSQVCHQFDEILVTKRLSLLSSSQFAPWHRTITLQTFGIIFILNVWLYMKEEVIVPILNIQESTL